MGGVFLRSGDSEGENDTAVSWKEREEDNLDCNECNDKATSRRRTGQLGNGCSSCRSGMMMVRVHGRQLGGMTCVGILAASRGEW